MGSIKKAFDLTGKNALVTGGSRGPGLQIAEARSKSGHPNFELASSDRSKRSEKEWNA